MLKITLSVYFVLFLLILSSNSLQARPNYADGFNAEYPGSPFASYSCVVCHPGGTFTSLNSYASDWTENGKSFAAIENLDSDNDGFINLIEIEAGTFPGNPDTTLSDTNNRPIADAGLPQTVDEGVTVILDGSSSTDLDNGISSYQWDQILGSGPTVTLSDADSARATFVTPVVDNNELILYFALTVEDNEGLLSVDQVTVTIEDNGITTYPPDILTTKTYAGDDIGIEIESGDRLTRLETGDETNITLTEGMPEDLIYGLIDLEISVTVPGAETTVTIYLPEPAPAGYKWYKYNNTDGWMDFSSNADFNATRDQVTLRLTDGGMGDDDGFADGVIVDPSGLGIISSYSSDSGSTVSTSGSAGGDGCFIATAAYGSSIAPSVLVLKQFRDQVLFKNTTGKTFVKLYYDYSPPLADIIAKHSTLRAMVRWSLLPLIGFSRITLFIGFVPTMLLSFSLLLILNAVFMKFFFGIRQQAVVLD